MARWENENFNTQEPPTDVMCTTCKFRMKPIVIGGQIFDRSRYDKCDKFETKPQQILWGEVPCPMYEQEVTREF